METVGLEQVSQEEIDLLKGVQEELEEKESVGFESIAEEESEFNAAVVAMNAEIRMQYSQVHGESVQPDVEMIIASEGWLANLIKKWFQRLVGSLKNKIKQIASRGRDAVCAYLKKAICGNLGIFSGKIICNLGLPRICKALWGWIQRKLGI